MVEAESKDQQSTTTINPTEAKCAGIDVHFMTPKKIVTSFPTLLSHH